MYVLLNMSDLIACPESADEEEEKRTSWIRRFPHTDDPYHVLLEFGVLCIFMWSMFSK